MFRRKNKNTPTLERRRPVSSESRSPQAFSYRANRSRQDTNTGRQLPSDPESIANPLQQQYWLRRTGFLAAIVVILVCAFYLLSLSANPRVVPLTNSSNNQFLQSSEVYQQTAEKLLKKSFVNRNKITIDTKALVRQLKSKFPELADVSVALPFFGHQPTIYIQPTQPVFVLKTTSGESFVIDDNGRALAETGRLADIGNLKLPVVTDKSGLGVKRGDIVLPNQNADFIKEVIRQLRSKHVSIVSMSLPAAASELDAKVAASPHPYTVKFNLHSNTARQQAGTFLAVRQDLGSKGITPASYIDVRLDGRAYYK